MGLAKQNYADEETLLNGLQQGDDAALAHMYQRYWPMILKFARDNQGTEEEAADLFQESIIILYEKTRNREFRPTCTLKTYLYSVCRNQWLYKMRGKRFLVRDSAEFLENLPGPEEEEAVALPDDAKMQEAIRQLGEPCYTLITGFYYHKRSMEQLAAALNYNSAAVAKQQKYRCVERLKKMFGSIHR